MRTGRTRFTLHHAGLDFMTSPLRLHWLIVGAWALWGSPAVAADPPVVSRIAFGSCAKQDKPQPIWDAVVETKPELFVFLGDNIYGDTADMDVLRAKYQLLA